MGGCEAWVVVRHGWLWAGGGGLDFETILSVRILWMVVRYGWL